MIYVMSANNWENGKSTLVDGQGAVGSLQLVKWPDGQMRLEIIYHAHHEDVNMSFMIRPDDAKEIGHAED